MISPAESRRLAEQMQNMDPVLRLRAALVIFQAGSLKSAPRWAQRAVAEAKSGS